jgi:hypothetical protein
MLINLHKIKLLEEIENQLSMGAENLMKDDKYLLECNLSDLVTTNSEQQEYWLLASRQLDWGVSFNIKQHNSDAFQPHRQLGNLFSK